MDAFEKERTLEQALIDNELEILTASFTQKMTIAADSEKQVIFMMYISKYGELLFNKVLLDNALSDVTIDEYIAPVIKLLESEKDKSIDEMWKSYERFKVGDITHDEMCDNIAKQIASIIGIRLALLKLGKLDA